MPVSRVSTPGESTTMTKTFLKLFNDESGATAVEYGLIAALIAVAIIATVTTLGGNLKNTFGSVANNL